MHFTESLLYFCELCVVRMYSLNCNNNNVLFDMALYPVLFVVLHNRLVRLSDWCDHFVSASRDDLETSKVCYKRSQSYWSRLDFLVSRAGGVGCFNCMIVNIYPQCKMMYVPLKKNGQFYVLKIEKSGWIWMAL